MKPPSAMDRASRRVGLLVYASVLGLCGLIPGCEPESGTDASSYEAAVVEAGADPARSDASVVTSPLDAAPSHDATPTPGNDAAPPPNRDASTPTAADASSLDSTTADGAAMDSAMADGATADGAALDTESADGSRPVDAHAPSDAAAADGGSVGDGSSADAGRALRGRSGEVRWDVQPTPGSAFCPLSSIVLWKEETFTLHDPASPGFRCTSPSETCSKPLDLDAIHTTFAFRDGDLSLSLQFYSRILLGYSLESFRDNMMGLALHWTSPTKTSIGAGLMEFDGPAGESFEFVSYEAPLLHVRLVAGAYGSNTQFNQQATVPWVCFKQTQTGPVPSVCTEVSCSYGTDDTGNQGVRLVFDLKVPIQQPAP